MDKIILICITFIYYNTIDCNNGHKKCLSYDQKYKLINAINYKNKYV